jgi:hypothetical protein
MVKEDIKTIFRPGLDPLNTHTISDKLYCISDTIKVLATMADRYGNLIRNQQYQFWGQHLRERLDAFPYGEERPGWRNHDREYPESQQQLMRRQAEANEIVPRPRGYTPFQSSLSLTVAMHITLLEGSILRQSLRKRTTPRVGEQRHR